jgi:tetratricopeptide (TPR) repeat protein
MLASSQIDIKSDKFILKVRDDFNNFLNKVYLKKAAEKAYFNAQYDLLGQVLTKIGDQHFDYNTRLAVTYYNAAIAAYGKLSEKPDSYLPQLEAKIDQLLIKFSSESHSASITYSQSRVYKAKLRTLRDDLKQQVSLDKLINSEPLVAKVQQAYQDILSELWLQAKKAIGKQLTSGYSLLFFGSVGRLQATPYSDLEFGILYEDRGQTINQSNQAVLTEIVELLELMVINIGESPIVFSEIGFDLDSLIQKGLCFDLGGKTPLGRLLPSHAPALLGTPSAIAELAIDQQLTRYQYVLGNKVLVEEYEQAVCKKLELAMEDTRLTIGQAWAIGLMQNDYLKFRNNLQDIYNLDNGGMFFSVKSDFYRLPTLFIEHLATYFGSRSGSIELMLNDLVKQAIITKELKDELRILITIVNGLRYRAYLQNDMQNEQLIIASKPDAIDQLYKLYCITRNLAKTVRKFCIDSTSRVLPNSFITIDEELWGLIYLRLDDYSEALKRFEKLLNVEPDDSTLMIEDNTLAFVYGWTAHCYEKNGEFARAEDFYRKSLDLASKCGVNILIPSPLVNLQHIAELQVKQGKYPEACLTLQHLEQELAENSISVNLTEMERQAYLNEINIEFGTIYVLQRKREEAKKYFQKVIENLALDDSPETLRNKGLAYGYLGDFARAIAILEQVLPHLKSKYPKENLMIKKTYLALAYGYKGLNNYEMTNDYESLAGETIDEALSEFKGSLDNNLMELKSVEYIATDQQLKFFNFKNIIKANEPNNIADLFADGFGLDNKDDEGHSGLYYLACTNDVSKIRQVFEETRLSVQELTRLIMQDTEPFCIALLENYLHVFIYLLSYIPKHQWAAFLSPEQDGKNILDVCYGEISMQAIQLFNQAVKISEQANKVGPGDRDQKQQYNELKNYLPRASGRIHAGFFKESSSPSYMDQAELRPLELLSELINMPIKPAYRWVGNKWIIDAVIECEDEETYAYRKDGIAWVGLEYETKQSQDHLYLIVLATNSPDNTQLIFNKEKMMKKMLDEENASDLTY